MITIKNVIILLLIESTIFYGGFYFNDVLKSMDEKQVIAQCIDEHEEVKHVVKKKRIRLGNTRIVNEKSGWGF
jgi:hypothetical protein